MLSRKVRMGIRMRVLKIIINVLGYR